MELHLDFRNTMIRGVHSVADIALVDMNRRQRTRRV
jgi:hypothetical protein